ncbi:hypothetical protein [Pseudoduganella lutea]|uniref:Uncharacterized protein n=1 Tax=Pseudoduganella lutea TaxID=321985 RepID=A0A4P6L3V4_9BURK|nr:hypothetical protein [Pseudoduganella lutea]QBE66104.1 hypothetical protein EWM63_26555 [Pseudoduganella lutea]
MQNLRGFGASPSGDADRHRSKPATLPPGALDPGARGAPVGKGWETYGALQVIDENGRRVALAAEPYDGAGLDGHAEARSIRALEAHGPARIENGRLVVVVDQEICPSCRARLIAYAERKGITRIEAHLPVRDSMSQAGKTVTPRRPAAVPHRQGGRRLPCALPSRSSCAGSGDRPTLARFADAQP